LSIKPLEDRLHKLGYDFSELADSIYLVYNVYSEEDLAPVWDIINSATQADWEYDYRQSQIGLARKRYGREDLDKLLEEGLMEFTDDWYDKAISIPEDITARLSMKIEMIFAFDYKLITGRMNTIQRQYEGSPLVAHVDTDGDPSIAYAAIGYINDDYSDGELFFSELGLEVKPRAGSLMIFPGSSEYRHGVKAPGPGKSRYALPTFVFKS
jgi:hypothetical protein